MPYGVDNKTPERLQSSSIPAMEFQNKIAKLAARGRVLVLLDACRSAGLIGGKQGADLLRSVLAANNVTVLTSSKADKLSREDEKWGHGAFTKRLRQRSLCAQRVSVDLLDPFVLDHSYTPHATGTSMITGGSGASMQATPACYS